MLDSLSGTTAAIIDGGALAMVIGGGLFVIRWLNRRLEAAEAEIREMHGELRDIIQRVES